MKQYSIDRIEGTKAVLIDEDGNEILAEASSFDTTPNEGFIVTDNNGKFSLDRDETQRRRRIAIERLNMVLGKSGKEDEDPQD